MRRAFVRAMRTSYLVPSAALAACRVAVARNAAQTAWICAVNLLQRRVDGLWTRCDTRRSVRVLE